MKLDESFSPDYLTSADIALAEAYMREGGYSEAAWTLRNALLEKPGDLRVQDLLAECAATLQQADAASGWAAEPATILVGGTGRSGTTMFRAFLASHPRVTEVPGEMKQLADSMFRMAPYWFHSTALDRREEALAEIKRLWLDRFYAYQLQTAPAGQDSGWRGLFRFMEIDELEAELPRLDAMLDADTLREVELAWGAFYTALFPMVANANSAGVWVDKTPNNAVFARFLHAWMPQARLLEIVRDGRDVALSLQRMTWRKADLVEALAWWARRMRAAQRALAVLPDGWHMTVRYEDLVLEPSATMRSVVEFCGIEDDFGFEPFKTSVDRWKTAMPTAVQEHALAEYGDLLEAYGYELAVHPNAAVEGAG